MGKNKLAKFAEMARFPNVIQITWGELLEEEFSFRGRWSTHCFGNQRPLVVELGCGKGEYTVALAERFPQCNYIGIDIKGARIYTGARYALDKGLQNVVFVRTRIENAGLLFGPGEVSQIWLTFPDPQMKNARKRLTSGWFIRRYREFLEKEGIIHCKTDSLFLWRYTRALARMNGFRILEENSDLYRSSRMNEVLAIRTHYESQWLNRGIPIKYLAFLPGTEGDIREPEEDFERDGYRSHARIDSVRREYGGFFQQGV